MPLTPTTVFNDRYELVSLIAEGGMGEVWKATDRRLNRTVAIKTVRARFLKEEPKAISIFRDEAKAGARLMGHPNVIGILDTIELSGDSETSCLIVMEFVDGITLSQWISAVAPRLDPQIAHFINLHLAWQFCRAIHAAHKNRILHRDIKPHNAIISRRGHLKVADFGLARFIDALTRTHTVAGANTPAYAAPEQWSDEKQTENTDLYQLGCTVYQLFSGALPFEKQGLPALMTAHLNARPAAPSSRNALITPELDVVVLKLLSKQPSDRGAIWELNDIICEQMCGSYELGIDFSDMSAENAEFVSELTDIARPGEGKDPVATITFPDGHEVLEEAAVLAFMEIPFTLTKKTGPASSFLGVKTAGG
ncbi:serine/threonine-protein kinase [Myxococcus xanthus]|uniref:serine/threonine-protein kinase n=1 Tax=Myxococcus xanthus TaxID=34 RepID=UPI001126AF9F|nr:serine/threonine-protein kinase [Myxococcus xanthus]